MEEGEESEGSGAGDRAVGIAGAATGGGFLWNQSVRALR